MPITELNLTPGPQEYDWVSNISVADASAGIVLKPAVPDYKYGIKGIAISTVEDEKQIELLNGDLPFIGPIELGKYIPITLDFEAPVYCTAGNALILKTETAFDVYLLIKGITAPPVPSKSFNPSPVDGAMGVSISPTLSWESLYQSVGYEVYLGQNSNSLSLVSTQDELTYSPSLSAATTYYWRIDETLGNNTASGNVWTFTTA